MSKFRMIGARIYVTSLLLYILFFYIYFFITKFEKTVTISDEFLQANAKSLTNMVADTKGTTYALRDVLLLWSFNTSDNIVRIAPGETYLIKGYGVRIPFLSLHPTITSVSFPPL
jgi:hypothetical protein